VAGMANQSGLTGRGGAGFPSVRKWDAIRRVGRPPLLAVNAMEGEPASAKDRVLLNRAPHLVLDGAALAAGLVGAREIVICLPAHDNRTASVVAAALAERRTDTTSPHVELRRPPGGYVTGEESALVHWLADGLARPTFRPDKSHPLVIGRRPVLVHNAETLAQLALIVRHGPDWFRGQGTEESPGSTLVTISGLTTSSVVLEVELGTPMRDILACCGLEEDPRALLLGGYGGAWLDGSQVDLSYAHGPLTAAGATLGVGVLVVLPARSCGVAETARLVRYMAGQSAGQCGPCVFGLPVLADDLEQLAMGRAGPMALERVARRSATIEGRGACRHPDGVVRLVRSALTIFRSDVRAHASGRPCAHHNQPSVLCLPGRNTETIGG
jgi:NADH:ubiquinone oxidoreductase subunit F (NADH-binding)